jgi:endogenous inhibitor of DNA gyrase (YacG/DUF329 family)
MKSNLKDVGMTQRMTLVCPACTKRFDAQPDNRALPFCCERCRMADLNGWFTETRSLPHVPDPDDDEPIPEEFPE